MAIVATTPVSPSGRGAGLAAAAETAGPSPVLAAGPTVLAFGPAPAPPDPSTLRPRRPILGITPTPTAGGYWLTASDGGIFAFGDARFYGSTGNLTLNQPIVAMAATPTGDGYWLAARDGGIFAFGDAAFAGSGTGRLGAGRVAAGLVPLPSAGSYWMLAVPGRVRVGFAGDVHGVGRVGATLASGMNPLAPIAATFATNDVNVVNLETAVGSAGAPQAKQYVFQSPPSLLSALRAAGVGVVNLANNHALDYGAAGLLETIDLARAAGLAIVGAGRDSSEAYAPAVIATPGGSVAVIGLSQVVPPGWAAGPGRPGVASVYDLASATNAIRAARAAADHVVVMIHWGIERDVCPSGLQRATAAALVAAGAEVVAGGHPHVLQGLTTVGGSMVAYSLGNFVWYDNSPPADLTGVLSVELAQSGVTATEFTPARIDGGGRPIPLTGDAATAARAYLASLAPASGRC
ncbi:MAG TPA: CapA family protein [Acidimicrobiales bacterium]|nr:CapA family protein [Acidimicrobiales bacterium]